MTYSPLPHLQPPRRRPPVLNVLRTVLAVLGALTVLTLLTGLAGAVLTGSLSRAWNLQEEIDPIRVLDRGGADLGVIDHCENTPVNNPVRCRESLTVPLSGVSRAFLLAYVAKEDVRYFHHPGIDLGRMPGAFLSRAGGSTITMQLLKNNVLAGHFDYDTGRTGLSRVLAGTVRKATEYVLAPLITLRYSKEEVLAMSVNSLPWLGIGQRKGIHDAARIMFGVRASDLDLAQSAFLVGLLPRPGTYLVTDTTSPDSATRKFQWMRTQQLVTLGVLRDHGLISAQDYNLAASERLQPSLWNVQYAGEGSDLNVVSARRNPDYRNDPDPAWTLQELVRQELRQNGVAPARAATVTLTIDAAAQRDLTGRVTQNRPDGIGEGAAIVDVRSGGLIALASSTGGDLSAQPGRQWAAVARRPVASTVKPLLYSAAFGRGLSQISTFMDQPTRYYGQQIGNNTGEFLERRVTVREANTRSLNTVAVQVGLQNEDALARVLRAVGYSQDDQNRASPALGTWRASPSLVAGAYASFANGGMLCRPHLILSVHDRVGKRIPLADRSCTRLWDENVAFETFDMLGGAVNDPSSHVAFLRSPFLSSLLGQSIQLGAKSGTTDNVQDTWCAGVTPEYAMGVWIGDPNGVNAVPTDLYRHQAACRELSALRALPHTVRALIPPAGITRIGGAAVPAAGITPSNPTPTAPQN